MRRIAACLAAALMSFPAMAVAQSYAWGAGVANLPIGDTGDGVKTGFGASVGVGFGLGAKKDLSFNVEGLLASNNAKVGSGSLRIMGGFANIECDFNSDAKMHPYIYGGVGMVNGKPEGGSGDTKFSFQAGVGGSNKFNKSWSLFADVRYLRIASDPATTYLPVTVGLAWTRSK